jgi:hypothetical protein
MMPLLLTFCLGLMLLSALRRDWLVYRSRLARAALRDLHRALPLDEYLVMVEAGLPQLEQACATLAAGPADRAADACLLDVIHLQARTLTPVMRERLRRCADVAALLDAAPGVAPVRAGALCLPAVRHAARAAAWSRHALTPLRHLRLHLALLRWGLGRAACVLLGLRSPLRQRERRRAGAGGADFGRLVRASVHAYTAVLRSPSLALGETMESSHGGPTLVM